MANRFVCAGEMADPGHPPVVVRKSWNPHSSPDLQRTPHWSSRAAIMSLSWLQSVEPPGRYYPLWATKSVTKEVLENHSTDQLREILQYLGPFDRTHLAVANEFQTRNSPRQSDFDFSESVGGQYGRQGAKRQDENCKPITAVSSSIHRQPAMRSGNIDKGKVPSLVEHQASLNGRSKEEQTVRNIADMFGTHGLKSLLRDNNPGDPEQWIIKEAIELGGVRGSVQYLEPASNQSRNKDLGGQSNDLSSIAAATSKLNYQLEMARDGAEDTGPSLQGPEIHCVLMPNSAYRETRLTGWSTEELHGCMKCMPPHALLRNEVIRAIKLQEEKNQPQSGTSATSLHERPNSICQLGSLGHAPGAPKSPGQSKAPRQSETGNKNMRQPHNDLPRYHPSNSQELQGLANKFTKAQLKAWYLQIDSSDPRRGPLLIAIKLQEARQSESEYRKRAAAPPPQVHRQPEVERAHPSTTKMNWLSFSQREGPGFEDDKSDTMGELIMLSNAVGTGRIPPDLERELVRQLNEYITPHEPLPWGFNSEGATAEEFYRFCVGMAEATDGVNKLASNFTTAELRLFRDHQHPNAHRDNAWRLTQAIELQRQRNTPYGDRNLGDLHDWTFGAHTVQVPEDPAEVYFAPPQVSSTFSRQLGNRPIPPRKKKVPESTQESHDVNKEKHPSLFERCISAMGFTSKPAVSSGLRNEVVGYNEVEKKNEKVGQTAPAHSLVKGDSTLRMDAFAKSTDLRNGPTATLRITAAPSGSATTLDAFADSKDLHISSHPSVRTDSNGTVVYSSTGSYVVSIDIKRLTPTMGNTSSDSATNDAATASSGHTSNIEEPSNSSFMNALRAADLQRTNFKSGTVDHNSRKSTPDAKGKNPDIFMSRIPRRTSGHGLDSNNLPSPKLTRQPPNNSSDGRRLTGETFPYTPKPDEPTFLDRMKHKVDSLGSIKFATRFLNSSKKDVNNEQQRNISAPIRMQNLDGNDNPLNEAAQARELNRDAWGARDDRMMYGVLESNFLLGRFNGTYNSRRTAQISLRSLSAVNLNSPKSGKTNRSQHDTLMRMMDVTIAEEILDEMKRDCGDKMAWKCVMDFQLELARKGDWPEILPTGKKMKETAGRKVSRKVSHMLAKQVYGKDRSLRRCIEEQRDGKRRKHEQMEKQAKKDTEAGFDEGKENKKPGPSKPAGDQMLSAFSVLDQITGEWSTESPTIDADTADATWKALVISRPETRVGQNPPGVSERPSTRADRNSSRISKRASSRFSAISAMGPSRRESRYGQSSLVAVQRRNSIRIERRHGKAPVSHTSVQKAREQQHPVAEAPEVRMTSVKKPRSQRKKSFVKPKRPVISKPMRPPTMQEWETWDGERKKEMSDAGYGRDFFEAQAKKLATMEVVDVQPQNAPKERGMSAFFKTE